MAALSTQQTALVDALANAVTILLVIELRETQAPGGHLSASEIASLKAALVAIGTSHAQVLAGS